MKFVRPKIFLVGETRAVEQGLQAYLDHAGVSGWTTDASSDAERLCEVFGRLCYRSFEPGLNPNVTRVRQGNGPYLRHIVEVGHGSVLEHASVNFIFADVSRVFTHELVRHRAGVAISQESLRSFPTSPAAKCVQDLAEKIVRQRAQSDRAQTGFFRRFAQTLGLVSNG